jgi:hypothetical protein
MIAFAPPLDYSRMQFPTDQLTIAHLRKLYPADFDKTPPREVDAEVTFFNALTPEGHVSNGSHLASILREERTFATIMYDIALNRSPWTPAQQASHIQRMIRFLATNYIKIGLAKGEHHALALLGAVATAAEGQAKARLGRGI